MAVAGVVLSLQLLVPPVVGLSNNGDFEKVMAPVGLDYLSERYDERHWSWALTRFAVVAPHRSQSGALYSEILLAGLAVKGADWFSPGQARFFDIRALGGVHIVLLLGAMWLILSACRELHLRTQVILALLLVFFFTDVGYAASFNSLYGQTASLLFFFYLVGITALAVRRGRLDAFLLVGYFLCAVLFVGSKPQECIHGPVLAALAIRLAGVARRVWRQPAVYLAAGLCAFSIGYYFAIPRLEIQQVARYHTVFMELLPHSPDPAGDLEELGLDADFVKYSGQNAYLPTSPLGDPDFQIRFFTKFGYGKLLRFYLSHPTRLADRIGRAARLAFRLRPQNLGNFEQSTGFPRGTLTSRFALWSGIRLHLGRHGPVWLVLVFGATGLGVCRGFRRASPRGRLFRVALGSLIVVAILEFLVCALADYLGDLPRHLYGFQAMFDLILIADAAWLIQALSNQRLGSRSKQEARSGSHQGRVLTSS